MRHTVVISDIHLCEVERTSGLWMRYRQAPYSPDRAIADMIAALLREVGDGTLCLVLNGDVFDFDAPRVIDGESKFHDQPRTAANAVPMLTAILDDHPVFVEVIGSLLASGHELVIVSGNHDAQLVFPQVREVLFKRLVSSALRMGGFDSDALRRRIVFRTWFHRTDDGIVIEHGNQYDEYCAHRYPMAPFGRNRDEVQPTLGSLAARNLLSRMGYFNPHVDRSYMLSVVGYAVHWARYYLFSRHSLAAAWMLGAVRTMASLIRAKHLGSAARRDANVRAAAEETGVAEALVAKHAALFSKPSEDGLVRVMRELWLDRFAFATVVLSVVALWLLLARGPMLAGAAFTPMLFVGYELAMPKPTLDDNWRGVQDKAMDVARIHGASAVVFGHTHNAIGTWQEGVFLGNCGSWSAAYRDIACTELLHKEMPLVWLRSGEGQTLEGGLVHWVDGAFSEV
jgi:UDP-2,3-diacylglucosamine pyrophosphatase LpxH